VEVVPAVYAQLSLEAFLDRLASSAPEPGGGAAAALVGATGAALVGMVANLTLGKPQFEAAWPAMDRARERAEALRRALLAAVDRDAASFRRVMDAYALPRSSAEEKAARREAIQVALREASREPAEVVASCREVAALSRVVAEQGNPQVLSDAAVAAVLAGAAAESAALNVWINLKAISDATFTEAVRGRVAADLEVVRTLRDEVTALAARRLG
jgi:formiminotetrahydrofolate cyclodeaminase